MTDRDTPRRSACRVLGALLLLLLLLLCETTGCSTTNVTLPARSATEQYLISTAADRALSRQTGFAVLHDRLVFIDTANLAAYDKEYVAVKVAGLVGRAGGRLTDDRYSADVILEVGSGALSIDHNSTLLGLPQLTLPIPLAGSFTTPELAIVKADWQMSKAKFVLVAYDERTGDVLCPGTTALGSAHYNNWWFLFIGPFSFTDLPDWPDEAAPP